MQFPRVTGSNLAGQEFKLPGGFEGEKNLALIAFQREQQSEIDSWLPVAQRLAQSDPLFRYYELPVIFRGNPLFRLWLDSAMRFGIPDQSARANTITLYLDKEDFRRQLGITSEDTIYAFLVDQSGEILWRGDGRCTPQKEQELTQAARSTYR